MEAFTDFLVSNYFWFLVTSIVLLFALIGYFVDQSEQKKGMSSINMAKVPEKNIEDLAYMAQNKSLNSAVTESSMPQLKNQNVINNSITDVTQSTVSSANAIGFDVLKK